MCDRACGNCASFRVLDDHPLYLHKWFGVCGREVARDLGCECGTSKAIDWVYDHGRHGEDGCERPDEWFKEEK